MAWLRKLTGRRKPREDAKPNEKAAYEDMERPRMINGIRAAKALQIMRQG